MGLVKIAVAIALESYPEMSAKMLNIAAATVLCNRIPDLFDYVCDEKPMTSYTVAQIRKNQHVLKNTYGYFDRYGCFSGELPLANSREKYDELWCGLKDDDLIYLIEAHI